MALRLNFLTAQNAALFPSTMKVHISPPQPSHNHNLTSENSSGECKPLMAPYLRCLRAHRGTNAPECRAFAKAYLQCRMERYVPHLPIIGPFPISARARLTARTLPCEPPFPLGDAARCRKRRADLPSRATRARTRGLV